MRALGGPTPLGSKIWVLVHRRDPPPRVLKRSLIQALLACVVEGFIIIQKKFPQGADVRVLHVRLEDLHEALASTTPSITQTMLNHLLDWQTNDS